MAKLTASCQPCKSTFLRSQPSRLPVRFCQQVALKGDLKGRQGTSFPFLAVFINIIQAGAVQPSNDNLPLSTTEAIFNLKLYQHSQAALTPQSCDNTTSPLELLLLALSLTTWPFLLFYPRCRGDASSGLSAFSFSPPILM